ncbi:carbamoyl-phosphate synthase subunit L [Rhizobium leguminosarum bv. trifolii]|uniref:Carbamoyl-phosphate synthase subunit L n=1 Tax=Rhizobium leguminosarum bv. trifolii TaxID=386 RepID=A0A3E1BTF2_RHILT|nr:ATP-grasp domain-containing protein [Rhizobium leguminosarum]RFB96302.1 carbamoyl-phosphate synthase subunit L [Rhizobium leguminosarum bv. trifolii]RFB97607.1 carbamoyl-phosphate synthase subunit L [Rhizobium leguminosarum bv. trifolii]
MKTILVSGASGIVGYGILRSLRKSGYDLHLVGTSIYPESAANGFSDLFILAPKTTDPQYMSWLRGVIHDHKVDMVIPGIEADLYAWVRQAAEIREAGAVPLLNNLDLIEACRDKWGFYQRLQQAGVACAIDTTLDDEFDILERRYGLPFIVKPRRGFGSKGVVKVSAPEDFERCREDVGKLSVAQRYTGSDDAEYTIAAFGNGQGHFSASMAMRRRLSKDGFTDAAEVVSTGPFLDAIRDLCTLFQPIGPTNFQFRMDGSKAKLLEINPRISSSTSIRAAFGYNESAMAVGYYLFGVLPDQPAIKGGRAIRYTEDLVTFDDRVHF